jgi:glycosyltransferase involved in cell wall biosynthesis
MAEADIGICPHAGGNFGALQFPIKIPEYMSQGLPVIANRTETVLRYIPEDAVFYFEPGSSADMAAQILRMWNNPAEAMSKIATGKALISRYTWEAEKRQLTTFYRELVIRQASGDERTRSHSRPDGERGIP